MRLHRENAIKTMAGAGGFEPPYGGIKIRHTRLASPGDRFSLAKRTAVSMKDCLAVPRWPWFFRAILWNRPRDDRAADSLQVTLVGVVSRPTGSQDRAIPPLTSPRFRAFVGRRRTPQLSRRGWAGSRGLIFGRCRDLEAAQAGKVMASGGASLSLTSRRPVTKKDRDRPQSVPMGVRRKARREQPH